MKVKLKDTFEFEYEGETVAITYKKPSVAALLEMEASEINTGTGAYQHIVENFLVGWNLENEDSTPYPTDLDSAQALPGEFMIKFLEAWGHKVMGVEPPLEQQSNEPSTSEIASQLPLSMQS